jgi:membrane-associated phospholipid phosphatase
MYGNFWALVTLFGSPVIWSVVIAGLVVLYFLPGKYGKLPKERRLLKKFLLLIIPALIISLAGSEILKIIFQVPRPCIPCPADGCNPYCPVTFSFPSCHTSTITGIATAFVLLLRKRRYLLIYVVPLLIAASRVELGVHTASDVTAGFLVGLVLTMLVWRYRKRIYRWEDEVL